MIIPVDSLSISVGTGLSITLKAGVELPAWVAVGSRSSVVIALAAKQRVRFLMAALGCFSSSWLTNVDGMKDL